MQENKETMVELVREEYERKYGLKCDEELASELLSAGDNDCAMVIKTIQRTVKHYKVKEFIEESAQKKSERKKQREKKGSAFIKQLAWMYEPFLDDKTIDQVQYNAIIAQRQGLPYNLHDYQQGIFSIQKQMYRHPSQWVHGLGLTRWEEQAFAELVPKQQEHFNIDLIRKAGIQYEKDFVPDADITPPIIQKMFGIQRIEIIE